jgi:rhodanese-related sulfurtransferase
MIDQVPPSALSDWFAQHTGAGLPLVLDVREPHELAVISVKPAGFEVLTIPMGTVPDRLADIDPQRPIAVLCHAGMRSQRVAMFLQEQGYPTLANIAGGVMAWPQ